MSNILAKMKNIKCFILDVDGILTSGNVLITENGDQLRTMNVKDGYAIKKAINKGYKIIVISGGSSNGVVSRMSGLGVDEIYISVKNKLELFKKIAKKLSINPEDCLSLGDDEPDCKLMEYCELGACPADAVDCIKEISTYISKRNGGKAFVREVIEMVLKLRGDW